MTTNKDQDNVTGRTMFDLLFELARRNGFMVVVVCVIAGFLAFWGIVHFFGGGISIPFQPPPFPVQPPQPVASTGAPTKGVLVDFSRVDTRNAPDYIVAADPYLHEFQITVDKLVPEKSRLVLMNNLAIYEGHHVRPTSSQNFLTQIDTGNTPASFTLKFENPVDGLSFSRPALYPVPTSGGITHPAWSAYALDAQGRTLSSQTEDLTRSFGDIPAQLYTLRAPGFSKISAVRFDSDPRLGGKPFAAFSAILIEQITLVRAPKEPDHK